MDLLLLLLSSNERRVRLVVRRGKIRFLTTALLLQRRTVQFAVGQGISHLRIRLRVAGDGRFRRHLIGRRTIGVDFSVDDVGQLSRLIRSIATIQTPT